MKKTSMVMEIRSEREAETYVKSDEVEEDEEEPKVRCQRCGFDYYGEESEFARCEECSTEGINEIRRHYHSMFLLEDMGTLTMQGIAEDPIVKQVAHSEAYVPGTRAFNAFMGLTDTERFMLQLFCHSLEYAWKRLDEGKTDALFNEEAKTRLLRYIRMLQFDDQHASWARMYHLTDDFLAAKRRATWKIWVAVAQKMIGRSTGKSGGATMCEFERVTPVWEIAVREWQREVASGVEVGNEEFHEATITFGEDAQILEDLVKLDNTEYWKEHILQQLQVAENTWTCRRWANVIRLCCKESLEEWPKRAPRSAPVDMG